ncbi:serine hydrolase domain-containing protein [Kribbella sp. ALI-6-A]|uniref:serine hydrolase domain-containing protein n=1 Tax=Kribbella sp. ALI-6-A TaxID=1933817 RepID=UPI001EDC9153|nr:serine hydrolase domain-containing protein [Kribbella sp. ALI-6-A]
MTTRLGRRPRLAVAGVLTAALVAAPATATAGGTSELQREVDAVVAAGATSATAEISTADRRVRASSGTAVAGSNRPVPANARFRIGSQTKAFLATVVLQLVDENQLRLDDTVGSLLPGVVPDGDRITVRQLLNHSSGLYEVLATMPNPRSEEFLKIRWNTWTTAELVARATAYPLVFTPGSKVQYNNTGYLVLGLIVEKLTGTSYADQIERRVIRPLHLSGTSVPGTNPFVPGPHAHGYLPLQRNGVVELVDITTVNPSIMNAAGEMISTTRDLNRFFGALLDGDLLPAHLLAELKTTAHNSPYGLGLISRSLSCGTAWGKDGDAPGYSTWTFVSPNNTRRVTVSVTWGAGNHKAAVNALLDKELCR